MTPDNPDLHQPPEGNIDLIWTARSFRFAVPSKICSAVKSFRVERHSDRHSATAKATSLCAMFERQRGFCEVARFTRESASRLNSGVTPAGLIAPVSRALSVFTGINENYDVHRNLKKKRRIRWISRFFALPEGP